MPPQVPQAPPASLFEVKFNDNLSVTDSSESDCNASNTSDEETFNKRNTTKDIGKSTVLSVKAQEKIKTSAEDWGYPGHLDELQFVAYEKFRAEVNRRNADFRATVFTFKDSNEGESYALCRWLRSTKFNANKTLRKAEEAMKYSTIARQNDYYPHTTKSNCLGVEPSIFVQQYPQFYHGVSKRGFPIFFAKAGAINLKGMACITTSDGIINYHWHDMYRIRNHVYGEQLKNANGTGRPFQRHEILYILDLNNLGSLSAQLLSIVKTQCKIDELCFPDAMNKMIIINSPPSFAMIWKLIRSWIDPHNAGKVEIFSGNRSSWEERLLEFVDRDQLPADYGGWETNDTMDEILQKEMVRQYRSINPDEEAVKEETYVLNFNKKNESQHGVSVKPGQKTRLTIFTNSKSGFTVRITNSKGKLVQGIPSQGIQINTNSTNGRGGTLDKPLRVNLEDMGIHLDIPGLYNVQLSLDEKSRGGNYLLASLGYKERRKVKDNTKKVLFLPGSMIKLTTTSLGFGTFPFEGENDNDDNEEQVEFYTYE